MAELTTYKDGLFKDIPYEEKVFIRKYEQLKDPFLTTIITSGVLVEDANISNLISGGSNFFQHRFFNLLKDTAYQNYDGKTDVTFEEVTGGTYNWTRITRMKGWKVSDFTEEFTNSEVMQHILSQIEVYKTKARQKLFLSLLEGLFKVSDEGWALHSTDISKSSGAADETNKLTGVSIAAAIQKACGDNSDGFGIVIMHSKVYQDLSALNLLEFKKYTDATGITGDINIATINGIPIIVNDNVPVDTTTNSDAPKYTTYILGKGMFAYGNGKLKHPIEFNRDSVKNGGEERVIIRLNEAFVPYGFTWVGDVLSNKDNQTSADVAVSDTEFTKATNYKIYADHKTIKMARIISN